jgi:thioredoxin 1
MDTHEVIHSDENSFDKLIASPDKPVVVDFWAPWCGPCRAIAPVLDKLAKEHGDAILVAKVNVDEAPNLADRYQITTIPRIIIFKGGKALDTMGPVTYDALVARAKAQA